MTVADLVMIVPSRGRPGNVRALREAWKATSTARSGFCVLVDGDDPCREEYVADAETVVGAVLVAEGERQRIGPLINSVAPHVADGCRAIGFMGDDHRPRTKGWDAVMLSALDQLGAGIVYGDDLIQRENLPTAFAMTSSIVRALGWMVPPGLEHLYIDDSVLALGREIGRIQYLPGVIIEHMHPIAGKAEWDDTYREANDGGQYVRDKIAYETWRRDHLAGDVERLQAVLHG